MNNSSEVYQFRVTLEEIEPAVWRRIQVPANYNFFDLHMAIQDAMGWQDCHLHTFEVVNAATEEIDMIGIPASWLDDSGFEEEDTLPGTECAIAQYFTIARPRAEYEYDFGDGWNHDVVLEDILPRDDRQTYPRCVAGARACPPEDVGGVPGYGEFLEVLADPSAEGRGEWLNWVGGSFDPERFDRSAVRFRDPQKYLGRDYRGPTMGAIPPVAVEIEGFSPSQIGVLLRTPFDEEHSPLALETEFEDEAFEAAPLVWDCTRYLRMLGERQPLKLTQAGNLPRRFLHELVAADIGKERMVGYEFIWKELPMKESDSGPLSLVNLVTARSGLTRKQHGKLLLTKKGEGFARGKKSVGALYRHLLEFYAGRFNWGYLDRYSPSWVLQAGFAYTLFLLQRYGDEMRPTTFYADLFRRAFPMVADDFVGRSYMTLDEEFENAFETRTFMRFSMYFGLTTQQAEDGRPRSRLWVREGPLLSRVIGWTEGIDVEGRAGNRCGCDGWGR